mgnify:CR=1 FL=1
MTFEEYWAKNSKPIKPPEFYNVIKGLAECVWDAAWIAGYDTGQNDSKFEVGEHPFHHN